MQFLFYDLETSGRSAKWQRIMQFGAQRVDEDLKPVGNPIEQLISLSDDILPEPFAVAMVHGITPQQTQSEGITESEFWGTVGTEIFKSNTCILGFNSIRFDDEFLRYSLWRNFRDPYEWAYANGNSRWDLLDVVRMTRALRPDGIEWPLDNNRLENLTAANGIMHQGAHTALSDVNATIDLARLIKKMQPKIWDWLLGMRQKKPLQAFLASQTEPFVYTSGSYPKEFSHTTLVTVAGQTDRGVWVYDLRVDPDEWLSRSESEIKAAMENRERLPIKQLQFNRAPAVAPLSVIDEKSRDRLQIDMSVIEKNMKKLAGKNYVDFLQKVSSLQEDRYAASPTTDPDAQLYDGFLSDADRAKCKKVVSLKAGELAESVPNFSDKRLGELFLRYKARNFPESLTDQERIQWETFRAGKIQAGLAGYYKELEQLGQSPEITSEQRDLLVELDLWAQSIIPEPD